MDKIYASRVNSPVGPLLLGVSVRGLAVLSFAPEPPAKLAGKAVLWEYSDEAVSEARQQLHDYFAGRRREFTIPLDLRGTEFQLQCWDQLQRIPFGETLSYAEVAQAVGRPNAYRAVGQANHHNPVAIIVPCHRVLAGGLALGGYGGGLATKAFLLRLEGAHFHDEAATALRPPSLPFTE